MAPYTSCPCCKLRTAEKRGGFCRNCEEYLIEFGEKVIARFKLKLKPYVLTEIPRPLPPPPPELR